MEKEKRGRGNEIRATNERSPWYFLFLFLVLFFYFRWLFFVVVVVFFLVLPLFFCLRLCVSVVFVVARNYGPNWWWRLMADTTERVFFIIICWLFLLFFLGGLLRSLVGRRIGLGNKTRRKRFGSCFFLVFFWFVGWFCLAVDRIDVSIQMKEKSIIWWSSSILIRNPK